MHSTSLRLMQALLASGSNGAHREALLRQAEMSTATFYRGMEPLLKAGLVREQGGYYVLPLDHPYNLAFKLWHDQGQLLELPAPVRDEIQGLVQLLQSELQGNLLALWLHGSAVQGALKEGSDLDFLAVLRKNQEVELKGTRDIQVTVFTANHFRTAFDEGDPFLRTVLAHGVLLFDRDFMREFYAKPTPSPTLRTWQERVEIQQEIESRMFFFLRQEEAIDEARQALASLAVAVGRSMLDRLGELPAGKPDMLLGLKLYFGPGLANLTARCLERTAARTELLQMHRELLDWQRSFSLHASHLHDMANGLCGAPSLFESVCTEMLNELFTAKLPESDDRGIDLEIQLKGAANFAGAVFKSFKGPSPRLQRFGLPKLRPLLLVVNSLREVVLSQRPPLSESLRKEAEELSITLLDSRQLLQGYIRKVLGLESDFCVEGEWFAPVQEAVA